MKRSFIYIAILLFIFASCQTKSFRVQKDGVVVHFGKDNSLGGKNIKIEVVSDAIIHVSVTPLSSFSSDTSLIINGNKMNLPKWEYQVKGDSLEMATSLLKTNISLKDGGIRFATVGGQSLLSEVKGGGKTFIPEAVSGHHFYQIHQVFNSPDNEAFYGLGQHQNSIMNFKGQDVDLFQFNTMIAVPFVVSDKNYGILWDNYSQSKFGDIRDYENISSLRLYGEAGQSGGLTATYTDAKDSSKVLLKRQESVIDYAFLNSKDVFPPELKQGGKATWTGFIETNYTGDHKFRLYSSGYVKVWINNQLVLPETWRQNWNPKQNPFTYYMEKGKRYAFRMEWVSEGGYLSLKWLSPLSPVDQGNLSLYSKVGKQINYYFIKGDNLDQVIGNYRELTGKAPIMPSWAMGLWQSRERYKTQDELISTVKEFRKREIPLDNIIMDWQYWADDQWGTHEFEKSRFPDADEMIRTLHNLNTHFMISVWPKFYPGTENFNRMNSKGFLYQENLRLKHKDWVGPGYLNTFYDAFNPGARKLYWQLMNEKLFSKGVDAWWLDASEPDIHSNLSLEMRESLMNPTAMGSGAEYFNAYPLMHNRAVYEGQRSINPDQRVFILTRSSFAGQQHFAVATWSGDVVSRWHDLKAQIPAGLNFSLSGIPFWTTDIGGFALEKKYEHAQGEDLDEWRELQTRWFQFGTFCPLFRVHGQYPYREMYNIAPEGNIAYETMLSYDKLRYRLMPYLYTLNGMVYWKNYTIMRSLVMDFEQDQRVRSIGDQFMLGPSILVCPVYEYKVRSRKVYLPEGSNWYNLQNGEWLQGGQTINAVAPLSDIPLFVKEGSILPTGPALQYTGEKKADPITLWVYTGKDASFELYEDEGTNYNYEKGLYSIIPIRYEEVTHSLIIGSRKGTFTGMLKERTFRIVKISKEQPMTLDYDRKADHEIRYDGQLVKINL